MLKSQKTHNDDEETMKNIKKEFEKDTKPKLGALPARRFGGPSTFESD